jgi:DNA-binding cell septation regulator SpoVG
MNHVATPRRGPPENEADPPSHGGESRPRRFNGNGNSRPLLGIASGRNHASLADLMNRASLASIERGNAYLSPQSKADVKIRRWQSFQNPAGTMPGFVSVEMSSGLVINDCKLMVGPNDRRWVAMPSVKQFDRDGAARLDANGRPTYSQIVEFASPKAADRFRDLVLDALRRQHPDALDKVAR